MKRKTDPALRSSLGGRIAFPTTASVLAELNSVKDDLVTLGNSLAADLKLDASHPEIQLLDIAVQKIERLRSLLERPPGSPDMSESTVVSNLAS